MASSQSIFILAFLLAKWLPVALAKDVLLRVAVHLELGLYDLGKSAESATSAMNNLALALGDMDQLERAEFDHIVSNFDMTNGGTDVPQKGPNVQSRIRKPVPLGWPQMTATDERLIAGAILAELKRQSEFGSYDSAWVDQFGDLNDTNIDGHVNLIEVARAIIAANPYHVDA